MCCPAMSPALGRILYALISVQYILDFARLAPYVSSFSIVNIAAHRCPTTHVAGCGSVLIEVQLILPTGLRLLSSILGQVCSTGGQQARVTVEETRDFVWRPLCSPQSASSARRPSLPCHATQCVGVYCACAICALLHAV